MSTEIKALDKVESEIMALVPSLKTIAPEWYNPERAQDLVMHARRTTPALLECSKESILELLRRSARTGLDQIGAGGFWPVPYFNGKTRQKEALFVPDYRGLIFLGKKNGAITHGYADVVKEADEFSIEKGDTPRCFHKPALSKRGNVIGAYAVITMPDGNKHIEWMDREELDKTRNSSKASQSGPWVDWFEEQCKKTVLKRAMKPFAGGSLALSNAMQFDNDALGLDLKDRTPIATPKEKEIKPESVSEARPVREAKDDPKVQQEAPESAQAEGLEDGEIVLKLSKYQKTDRVSKKTGKPFTVHGCIGSDGKKYDTFSDSIGKQMEQLIGKDVAVTYEEGQYGRSMKSIRPINLSKMATEAPQPEPVDVDGQPSEQEENLPF